MFLKRLEINGFKSFANKTIFEFPAGIIGIVGPNGSGKSNVTDAVRWLLGEREAKNLRGDKLEDLIFAGTSGKAKMSMAQVSLIFDNASGELPSEFKEVSITRRVTRAGVSQYFMNDDEVRLKDIIDFFSKAKLGTRGLTIINQGSADIFVRATPAERMMMVQEILGLREYQIKRTESERKLKNARINLDKVSAMIAEVAPRLRMLKRQTSRWEKRFDTEEELKSIEQSLYASKIKLILNAQTGVTQPLKELDAQLADAQKHLEHAEKNLKTVEDSSFSSKDLETLQAKKRDVFSQKSRLDREIVLIEAKIENLSHKTHELVFEEKALVGALTSVRDILTQVKNVTDVAALKEAITQALRELDVVGSTQNNNDFSDELKKLDASKETLQKTITELEDRITAFEKEEKSISDTIGSFNQRFKEVFAQREAAVSLVQKIKDARQRLILEQEKNEFKLDEMKRNIEAGGGAWSTFHSLALSPSFEAVIDKENLDELERRAFRLRGEIASIGEIDESVVKEAKEVEAHYEFLNKESTDLSNAIVDLDALIKELGMKIATQFTASFKRVNEEFNTFFRLMFGGGHAKMVLVKKEKKLLPEGEGDNSAPAPIVTQTEEDEDKDSLAGINVELGIPQKKIASLEVLSGGEKSLVSLAALFALISVSPPPFLILDEADSALDEKNSRRFAELFKTFSSHTQFIVVTHNRVTMEAADILYGVTMDKDGCSKVLSMKLGDVAERVA